MAAVREHGPILSFWEFAPDSLLVQIPVILGISIGTCVQSPAATTSHHRSERREHSEGSGGFIVITDLACWQLYNHHLVEYLLGLSGSVYGIAPIIKCSGSML